MPLSYTEQQVIQELEKQFSSPANRRFLAPLRRYADLLLVSLMMLGTVVFLAVVICVK